ncbi:MAG TPA: LLM class flavin-dependent oxidoreductase [Candidatus Tectomicrobia bacterium]
MVFPIRMGFGIFLAPFHRLGENPTLGFERNIELIQWLDHLGFDEAWIGEHHSAGWETIASPEVFIAAVAERTRHIKLGTGVVSLPYHHPFMVASRIVQLDHMTRGRAMLGVGPGVLTSDAAMLGIDPSTQRPRMDEALGIILRLMTETEPITYKSDWFELRNAVLQLRPYTKPHPPIAVASAQSPAGMIVAGKYGAFPLSNGVRIGLRGVVNIAEQWRIAQETATKYGRTLRREGWRLVMPVHLAETREAAMAQARAGCMAHYWDYFGDTLGFPTPAVQTPTEIIDRLIEGGIAVVGTPDDLIAAIERLDALSGGFGTFLCVAHEWANREQTLHSFELLARYVMPRFQGALDGLEISRRLASGQRQELFARQSAAVEQAHHAYEHQSTAAP